MIQIEKNDNAKQEEDNCMVIIHKKLYFYFNKKFEFI